jgi:hypothetical protein
MSTVSTVATVEPAAWPPRIKVDVTDTGTPNLFAATVVRLDPDGQRRPVRTADGNPLTLVTSGTDRVGTVYDSEAPYGAAVSYSTQESPATVSAEVTIPETQVWLVNPGAPSLSMPITVASLGPLTRRVTRGVYYPMGREFPVVQTDGRRKAPEWVLQVKTSTLDELDDLLGLVSDSSVLLLNVPASLNWGVETSYVSIGDAEEERLVDYAAEPRRYLNLPLTVVDRPVGGTQAARTLADLMTYSSLAALNAAYPTLAALQAGP